MRVKVVDHLCQGHAMCVLACPELFILDDEDGHASTLTAEVPATLEHAVQQAQRSCPEGAIEIAA